MKLEEQLRDALRPVTPGEDFAARVQARIGAAPVRRRRWAVPVALAASLLLAVGIAQRVQHERELRAHRQLVLALQITGSRLDAVRQQLEHHALKERS